MQAFCSYLPFSYPLFFLFFSMRKERITCTPTRKKRGRLLRRANSLSLAIATQTDSSGVALRMTWNIYRHSERSEESFNIDPETSGFCVVRSNSADTKEQKVRRTTTKCSEQRLFVKQNPRQFRVTKCLNN